MTRQLFWMWVASVCNWLAERFVNLSQRAFNKSDGYD